ncbi:hypothetical protein FQN57_002389 [Myotisia sp. PD_48]|nr:hypothetical protein FQN57_002389 [Myotisia sp. PD_48]
MPLNTISDDSFTPIRVRGKRYRPDSSLNNSISLDPGSVNPSSSPGTIAERPGKVPRNNKTLVEKSQGSQAVKVPRTLESLPAELLIQIFCECLECNLPRASPYIASALSSEFLYRKLLVLALWKDLGPKRTVNKRQNTHLGEGEREISRFFSPIHYQQPLTLVDRKQLQEKILVSRWCTYSRILSCFPICTDLSNFRPHESIKNMISCGELPANLVAARWHDYITHALWTSTDYNFNNVAIALNREITSPPDFLYYRYSPLKASVLFIPNSLIGESTWNKEKMDFLWLFRQLLDQNHKCPEPFSRDILHEGVRTAIVEGNLLALKMLLELDEHVHRTRSYPAAYCIPSEHFITAIRCSQDPAIFLTLVRACAESIPIENPELTEWALDIKGKHPQFSEWLLQLMVKLPLYQRNHSPRQSMYFYGMIAFPPDRSATSFQLSYEGLCADYKRVFGHETVPWQSELRPYFDPNTPLELHS